MRLWVCERQTASGAVIENYNAVGTSWTPFTPTTTWAAGGPLQVGRAKAAGAYGENWVGKVDEVRAYSNVIDADGYTAKSLCGGRSVNLPDLDTQ